MGRLGSCAPTLPRERKSGAAKFGHRDIMRAGNGVSFNLQQPKTLEIRSRYGFVSGLVCAPVCAGSQRSSLHNDRTSSLPPRPRVRSIRPIFLKKLLP